MGGQPSVPQTRIDLMSYLDPFFSSITPDPYLVFIIPHDLKRSGSIRYLPFPRIGSPNMRQILVFGPV